MSVQQSSIDGYVASKASRSRHEREILNVLRAAGPESDGYNNRQLAAIIKQPINVVTPATLTLRKKGLVRLAGRRKDTYSGVTVMFWRVASDHELKVREELDALRHQLFSPPRVWTHLFDIPQGVVVKEGGYWGWEWTRRADGAFGWRNRAINPTDEFGGWGPLHDDEKFYGPVTEVK